VAVIASAAAKSLKKSHAQACFTDLSGIQACLVQLSLRMGTNMALGQKLQFYRRLRRMSLRDVAEKADCSPSFLSQIELDRVSPTVKNLEKICKALDLTVSDFLRDDPVIATPVTTTRQRDNCPVVMQWSGAKLFNFFPPEVSSPFTALLLRVETGSVSPTRHSLHSLKELCIVLRGTLTCHIGKSEYPLAMGEGIFFDLVTPHFWSNPGSEVAEVLFTSPNSFHLFEQVENDVRWHVRWKRQKRRTKAVKRLVQVGGQAER
jgi:transcriptional regulator with XRE-family HTH domain